MSNIAGLNNVAEKQWLDNVMLTVLSIGQIEPWGPDGEYGFKQKINVNDETDFTTEMTVQSKIEDSMMYDVDVDMKLPFRLKWWKSKKAGSEPNIVGYCTQAKQKAPQQATGGTPAFGAQMPATAPLNQRQTFGKSSQTVDEKEVKKVRGMCRFGFLQGLVAAGMEPKKILEDQALLLDIECLVDVSMDGISATPPTPEDTTDHSQVDDGPPF